jgi:gliding motility-associated-like protein
MRALFVLVFSLFTLFGLGQGHAGTEFRFAFMKNLNPSFNNTPSFDISIQALENADVTVTFGTPDNIALGLPYEEQNISLNAGETELLFFGPGLLYQEITGSADQLSFHVVSSGNIRINATHNRFYFSEASAILPITALDNEYMVMSYLDDAFTENSEAVIVATEDNTNVTITSTQLIAEANAGVPFTINLNAGEVYTILSNLDITGSTIVADKAIAVFSGTGVSTVNNCGASSHLYEQLPPIASWGTSYAFTPFEEKGGDIVRFLAIEDNTEIYSSCDQLFTTLDAGESADFLLTEASLFFSEKNFLMAQYMTGAECSTPIQGDPNMLILTPINQGNTSISFKMQEALDDQPPLDPFNPILPVYYINVVMPTSSTGELLYNGTPVSGAWQAFNSTPELSFIALSTSSFTEVQTLSSTGSATFSAIAYAMTGYDAYTWSLGASAPLNYETQEALFSLGEDLTACEGTSVILSPDDPELILTWSTGEIANSIEVNEAGVYSATLVGLCSTSSDEIELSFTPAPLSFITQNQSICEGESTTIEVENPNPNFNYLWSNNSTEQAISVSEPGTYTLSTSNILGCTSSTSTTVTLENELFITVPELIQQCAGVPVILEVFAEGGLALWTENGQDRITIEAPGEYMWTAENECETQNGITIVEFEDCECNIYVPNAFTPDENGVNEVFQASVDCELSSFLIEIYNRWGEVVFKSENPNEAWNGNSGAGYYAQNEVYTYILTYQRLSDFETQTLKGSITILR